jgi:hypothetical protein
MLIDMSGTGGGARRRILETVQLGIGRIESFCRVGVGADLTRSFELPNTLIDFNGISGATWLASTPTGWPAVPPNPGELFSQVLEDQASHDDRPYQPQTKKKPQSLRRLQTEIPED